MAQDGKLTSEEKWHALSPAAKAVNIFLAVAIVGGVISGVTAKHGGSVGNSASSPATTAPASGASSSFTKVDALPLCTREIEARINRPETINYNLLDTTFAENRDNARFTITGTAENALGAATKFRGFCYFKNGRLTSAEVTEG